MKRKIKNFIAKLPGIRGFMKKWIKARKDIEALKKQNKSLSSKNAKLNKEVTELKQNLSQMSENVHRSCVTSDLAQLNIRHSQMKMEELLLKAAADRAQTLNLQYEEEIRLLKADRPLVSIIMLNRNGKHNLEILMNSFHDKQFYDNFEIICVDNASTDDSMEYLESWASEFSIKIVRNQVNMSFSAANNLGVENASGEYLLFLNNDTEVTDGWLDELLIAMKKADNPGAVGAKLIYPQIPEGTVNDGKSFSIQHNGIAFRDSIREKAYFIQPYNMGNGQADCDHGTALIERACVTAAVLMMKREAFDEIGGYDERYIYGYEDVDICLKLVKAGYKNYYCPTCLVYHYEFGTQLKDVAKAVRIRRLHNMDVFKGKWQNYLSEKLLEDKLLNRHLFTEDKLVVGLVVTESDPKTTAGDFFTAMEFANSLMNMGYEVKYLSRRGEEDWYDVGIEVDVLISLLDAYDISKIYNTKNDLIKIAWARNWFDRWCEKEFFGQFDLVFASSKTACEYVDAHSNHKSVLFPIATNKGRFYSAERELLTEEEMEKFHSDYAFTGSYWNVKRDIIDYLNPEELPYQCKIFGVNWEQIDKFKDCAQGFVLYEDMPKVYQNTKIVIDDANHVTKSYGAVNSRVFDALAAGALVLTNGVIGAEETFGGLLPSFNDEQEFKQKLAYYLENSQERKQLVSRLQQFVLEHHTYDARAEKLREILLAFNRDVIEEKTIDICGAMPDDETKKFWGDQHFAMAMKKEFEKCGYKANVLPRDRWYDRSRAKYVLVLRGPKPYYPSVRDGRRYIMWNISHPEDVAIEEYNLYDYVFFASEKMKREIGPQIQTESGVLLQCVDDEVMTCEEHKDKKYELLFVGNSRHVFRPILRDLLPTEHKLSVYGRHWEEFPVQDYVVDAYMDNDKVGQAYHDAKILLNDHWDDMRGYGIISNRIFDALAVGAFVISDDIPEITTLFEGNVVTYQTKEDLKEKIDYYLEHTEERDQMAKRGQEIVLNSHTFKDRIKEILGILREM